MSLFVSKCHIVGNPIYVPAHILKTEEVTDDS